jgi:hypothetical protein
MYISWTWWLTAVILATWGWRLGGLQFKASQGKKLMRPPYQSIKAGHDGVCLSPLDTWIAFQASPGIKVRPYLKNTLSIKS